MEIRETRDGPELYSTASLYEPVYFLEPREDRPLNVQQILGPDLVSSILCLTWPTHSHRAREKANRKDRKMSFWTDAPDGARVYSPHELKNGSVNQKPFQANPFGHLNPKTRLSEFIESGTGDLNLWIQAHTHTLPDYLSVKITKHTGGEPLLVVSGKVMHMAFPALLTAPHTLFGTRSIEQADPIEESFDSIVDKVRLAASSATEKIFLLEKPNGVFWH